MSVVFLLSLSLLQETNSLTSAQGWLQAPGTQGFIDLEQQNVARLETNPFWQSAMVGEYKVILASFSKCFSA